MDAASANDHSGSVAPTKKRGRVSGRLRCASTLAEDSGPSGGEDLDTQISMPAFHNQPRKKQRTSSASHKAPSEAGIGDNDSEANIQMVVVKSDNDYVCWYGCGVRGLAKLNNVGTHNIPAMVAHHVSARHVVGPNRGAVTHWSRSSARTL